MDLKRLSDLTDAELMTWYFDAIELQIGKYIKAIRNEMNKRSEEE